MADTSRDVTFPKLEDFATRIGSEDAVDREIRLACLRLAVDVAGRDAAFHGDILWIARTFAVFALEGVTPKLHLRPETTPSEKSATA